MLAYLAPGARWRLPACFLEQPKDVAVRVPDLRVGAVGRLFGLALERHPLRLDGLEDDGSTRHLLRKLDEDGLVVRPAFGKYQLPPDKRHSQEGEDPSETASTEGQEGGLWAPDYHPNGHV